MHHLSGLTPLLRKRTSGEAGREIKVTEITHSTGSGRTAPFSRFEWMIAWRYLRAKRAEGGVSVMTWISLIGITLAVAALIITLAVRSGFRYEFVNAFIGANAHVTVYDQGQFQPNGTYSRVMEDQDAVAQAVADVEGVVRAAPLVRGQVMGTFRGKATGVDVYGISEADLLDIPRVVAPERQLGALANFENGIAMGWQLAAELGATVGDRVKLISPNGTKTFAGTSPRVVAFEVVYIFQVGHYPTDISRVYMPFEKAQEYFNKEGRADEIEVITQDADRVEQLEPAILEATGPGYQLWTWRDRNSSILQALRMEDNVMFLILSILVLIASMNIVSGLIMLVKNKGRDIGILRTMGLSEGSVLRVFFICGASIGVVGTLFGLLLGVAFVVNIDAIFNVVNYLAGGGVWDPSRRVISELPARLEWGDVASSISLSLFLSFFITIFPARRAARMNPVEALRYE